MMAAQARRKSPARSRPRPRTGGNLASIAILLAGMVIGSLATILWQGAQTADGGIGAGIRQLFQSARAPTLAGDEKIAGAQPTQSTQPYRPTVPFDFFTVLPGLEIEVPTPPPAAELADADSAPAPQTPTRPGVRDALVASGAYMLQAASYRHQAEADRLKATLALNGLVSAIQKVTIQGRGDFYRVRLGPFASHAAMVAQEQQLSKAGIKALRLKVSGG